MTRYAVYANANDRRPLKEFLARDVDHAVELAREKFGDAWDVICRVDD